MPRSAASPDPAADASPAAAEPTSYEAAVSELEDLVARMEGGQMPLDRLLDAYRRGADLLSYCRNRLTAVENQVKLLDEGVLKDWPAA